MKHNFYLSLVLVSCLFSCSQKTVQHTDTNMNESGLIHTVYFWLNDSVTDQDRANFEQALEDLSKVPSIDKYYWGKPANTAQRSVTDHTYDYAINVFFTSVENEAKYQIDPLHLKFVDGYGSLFKEVIVYDNTFGN